MAFQHGKDTVFVCLMPPEIYHFFKFFGLFFCKVIGFAKIRFSIIELPFIQRKIKGRICHVVAYSFPSISPYPAIAQHFIILNIPAAFFFPVFKCIGHADAMFWFLRNTFDYRGLIHTAYIEHGLKYIDHVMILRPYTSLILDEVRICNDERHLYTAIVGPGLIELERGVARMGPPYGVVRTCVFRTQILQFIPGYWPRELLCQKMIVCILKPVWRPLC